MPQANTLLPQKETNVPATILERYILLQPLSTEGSGSSWLAQTRKTGAFNVIRSLHSAHTRENVQHAIFSAAQQTGTLAVRDLMEEGDSLWLVRDWIDGENLKEALAVLGQLTVAQARDLVSFLCHNLIEAADTVQIHGHLCPENILIDTSGRLIVSDHGIWANILKITDLWYYAPEVARGASPSAASDVYSLGALLYTSVCGYYPLAFTGEQATDQAVLATHNILQPPPKLHLGNGLGYVMWKALQPGPADRYSTVYDLLIAMQQQSTGRDRHERNYLR